jgi:Methyltransferase domain
MLRMKSEQEIIAYYQNRSLNDEENEYLRYNAKRLSLILKLIDQILPTTPHQGKKHTKILDVGPSFLTEQIHCICPDCELNTLGYENPRTYDKSFIGHHLQYDLNNAQFPDKWETFYQHDLIVVSEVVEHLYTSPILVLSYLRTLLLPGGLILLTVPNALAISKRLKMLFGKHPYDLIRESSDNPGHYREYTRSEITSFLAGTGFELVSLMLKNYQSSKNAVFDLIYRIGSVLPSYRQGILVVLKRP